MNSANMYNHNKFKGCTIFLSLLGKNPGVIRKASRNYEEILGWQGNKDSLIGSNIGAIMPS